LDEGPRSDLTTISRRALDGRAHGLSLVVGGAPAPNDLLDLIDRLQFGIVLASSAGEASFANAYAKGVLDLQDGLAIKDGLLEAIRPQDTRLLLDGVQRAIRGELRGCVTLLLPRRSARYPLAVHIPELSVRDAGAATILIADPSRELTLDSAALCRLYGLTRAEAGFVQLLVHGKTVEQAADTLFISVHTARTHLKRILLKTDTGRQAELLRVVLSSAIAQVRLGDTHTADS